MDIDNKRLERDIENAIRARGLKEQMHQWDTEAKGEKREVKGDEAGEQKITPWRKIRRTIYSLSAVAAVAAILIVAIPASTYRQVARWGYRQYAQYILKQQPKQPVVYEHTITELMAMAEPSVKNIADSYYELEILGHENPMNEAFWLIIKGNYDMAQILLSDARKIYSEPQQFNQSILYDIEYLEAICYLGQNQRKKALNRLTAIANSDSPHKDAAATLAAEMK